jgi:two-component system OmpR family sensor kinase
MTLRRRLTLWYGALLSFVLIVAFTLVYLDHAASHDADVNVALQDMSQKASAEITSELRSGVPMAEVTLAEIHRVIDEPHAVWVVTDGLAPITAAGRFDEPAFHYLGLATIPLGYHEYWTEPGRVRTFVTPIADSPLRIVAAATLNAFDTENAQLRLTMSILGTAAVVVGMAVFSSLAGRALRPVAELTETAAEIARSRDFSRRVHRAGDEDDELVRLAATFDSMLSSLDSAYRAQQRFVGDVSHELRTPLTVIRGNADLLAAEPEESPERQEAIAQIRREADRLSRLVSDLLALARSETAETFIGRPVQLDEVVVEAFMEMRQLAGPRLGIGELDAVSVCGERDRLTQLIVALLDNALRYTPDQRSVAISLLSDGGAAVIQVDDDGIGIPAADMPHVFERFYRGDSARRADRSGSGLGLAIARWIVERHGGTIALEPRFPRGTRVTVRLATDGKGASREATPAA